MNNSLIVRLQVILILIPEQIKSDNRNTTFESRLSSIALNITWCGPQKAVARLNFKRYLDPQITMLVYSHQALIRLDNQRLKPVLSKTGRKMHCRLRDSRGRCYKVTLLASSTTVRVTQLTHSLTHSLIAPQQVPFPLQLPLWRHAKPGKHGVDLPKYKLTNTNLPKINRRTCLRLRGQSVVAPILIGAVFEAVATLTKDTLAQEQFNTGMREKQLSGASEWPASQCKLSPQATG
ncbi:unnamed protein product [Fusarium venenatum]|uniref:Uncharacterized protein n=1 Tax=Fusarium venenatum TaxID=56646 RepID=A0A2L2TDS5_9HYPO|nr:uncharacterized protein FVRRES_09211 [Fusarium venenatum]CEI69134.1 unnamed protein product [Fusarium venenatum]